MIPNEAVEAAMGAWLERSKAPGSWSLEEEVRAALEAAAPHIRAQALDDSARKLRSDMDVPQRIWVANKVFALAMIERGDA